MAPGRGGIDEGVVPVPRLSSRTLAGIVLWVGLATTAGPALGASTFSAPDRNDHIDFGFPKRAIAAGDVTGDGFPDIGMVGTAAGALWSQPGTAVPVQPILIGGAAAYDDRTSEASMTSRSPTSAPMGDRTSWPSARRTRTSASTARAPAGSCRWARRARRPSRPTASASTPTRARRSPSARWTGPASPSFVVVGESGGAVHYLTAGGAFDASRLFGPTNLTDVALGDFGGSQLIDIAVAGPGGAVVVLDKGSSLTPGAPVVAGPAASIVAGDFNRDGRPDIAVSRPTENEVVVRLGQGGADAAAFGPGVRVPVIENPGALAVADLDLNGTLDLVVARRSDQEPNPTDLHTRATVLEGVGNGTFTVGATIDTSTEPPPARTTRTATTCARSRSPTSTATAAPTCSSPTAHSRRRSSPATPPSSAVRAAAGAAPAGEGGQPVGRAGLG